MINASEARFARAMNGRGYGANVTPLSRPADSAAAPAPSRPVQVPLPVPDGLPLGELETGGIIAVDLAQVLTGRLLIQGVSGAGKSWALRRILEQARGQVQIVVVDPEGEFESLAVELEILHVKGHQLDGAALRLLGSRAREHRTSLVLDLSELDRAGQMIAVAAFLEAMIEAPRDQWHPVLVAIDEAHLFAPFGGHSAAETAVRKAAIGSVVDLMGRGRKRGLAGVLATQRLARLAKSVASEVQNFLVGLNTMDLDIKRAAEQIGWDSRKAFDRLPLLKPGEFVAVGRAFSSQPAHLKVGPVQSAHGGAAPVLEAPSIIDAGQARTMLGLDELEAATQSDRAAKEQFADDQLPTGSRALRRFIRDKSFVLAARIFGALKEVAPDGVTIENLAAHLEATTDDVTEAMALLDEQGALHFTEVGAGGPVALAREFT